MSLQQQTYTDCPVCKNDNIALTLQAKDYSLTQESFDILVCKKCAVLFTFPAPSKTDIAPYYNFPNYISHTDVKEGWMNKLYHKVKTRTLLQKTKWVAFVGGKSYLPDQVPSKFRVLMKTQVQALCGGCSMCQKQIC